MLNQKWYDQPKSEAHSSVFKAFDSLKDHQGSRQQADIDHLRFYGNLDLAGGFGLRTFRDHLPAPRAQRSRWNVIKATIDALASRIAKNKPRPKFDPNGGDPSIWKRSKLLTQFVLGQIHALDLYATNREVFKDGGIFGTGVLKLVLNQNRNGILAERVLPFEIWVDDIEGMYGKPRQLFQVKTVPKELLVGMYPSKKDEILMASLTKDQFYDDGRTADFVDVVEAWHLPSKANGKDGRHIICVDNLTLLDEPYIKNSFPFVFWRWDKRPLGFYGQGIAEQLEGIQIEINQLLYKIQRSMELNAVPFWGIEKSAEIPKSHISNEIGRIIRYTRTPPQLYAFPSMHPEVFQHLERQYQKAFEMVGLSRLTATSQKPSGLNSGRALIEYNDIETERFASVAQAWEEFYLDIAKHLVDLAKDIYDISGSYAVPVKRRSTHEMIDWDEVNLNEDQYRMSLFATSLLPAKPEGKLQRIEQLMQMQMIGPDDAKDLLDIPDLDRYQDIESARRQIVRETVEHILTEGEYIAPEPLDNLDFALKYATQSYAKARLDKYPDENLELLRNYIDDVQALIKEGMQAQQTQEPQAPTPPQGV